MIIFSGLCCCDLSGDVCGGVDEVEVFGCFRMLVL